MRTMSQSSTNYGSTNRRSVYYLIVPNCVDCGDVIFMYGSLAFSLRRRLAMEQSSLDPREEKQSQR